MRLGFKSWAVVAVDMVTFSAVAEFVLPLRFAILVLAPYGGGSGVDAYAGPAHSQCTCAQFGVKIIFMSDSRVRSRTSLSRMEVSLRNEKDTKGQYV